MLNKQLIFVAALVATVCAEISSRSIFIEPTAPVVCAMTVCPTNTLIDKRAPPACPSSCPDSCHIIDDQCCPGLQKAICNIASTKSDSAHSSAITHPSAISSSAIATSGVSLTAFSSIPSSSASQLPTSAAPSTPGTAQSSGNTIQIAMSGSLLTCAIVAGLNYF
ncbi:hypothetical protein BY458DRAFT_524063 [Sporodiniella umbellata]|nr:hypothetical protein BY458DRAFT_524063 [Sporodiniella umbellata]